MSNTIRGGRSIDLNVQAGESLKVSTITGTYTATVLAGAGAGTALATESSGGATYGPYAAGVVICVKCSADGLVDIDVGVSPALNYAEPARFGYGLDGDVSSLVDGDGNAKLALYVWRIYIFPSGDITGATDSANYASAVAQLNDTGGIVHFVDGDFYILKSTVTGGKKWIDNNWTGGILTRGASRALTRIRCVDPSGSAFVVDANPGGAGRTAGTMYDFSDFHLIGAGRDVSGGIGIDFSSQGNYQSTISFGHMRDVLIEDFETCSKYVDVTGFEHTNVRYKNYVYAVALGYNADILEWNDCQFGENTTALGAQSEVSFVFDATSPYYGTPGANNIITRNDCWFMRQLIVDKVNNNAGVAAIKHNNSYLENCRQYGVYGTAATGTSAPKNIVWDACHFSIVTESGETSPKFKLENAANDANLVLRDCATDSSTGPHGGWVDVGSSFSGCVEIQNSRLVTAGSANAWIIKYGNKLIPGINYRGRYRFATMDNNPDVTTFRGVSQTVAQAQMYAVTPADALIYARWAALTASSSSSTTPDGYALDIINFKIGGTTNAAALSGWYKTQQAASGSKPAAEAALRGVLWVTQGGAGVADTAEVCLKSAADTYSWKVMATG